MKLLKTTMTFALIGFLTLGIVQQSNAQTVVGVASENEDFTTLVAAVQAADLVSTLDGAGPFTVFAPTNEAFGKLPDGTVETLLKPENKPSLTGILTYHVVSGKFMAEDVVKAIQDNDNTFVVETVQGSPLTLSIKDGSVILIDVNGNSSTVTSTDVEASNGVIWAVFFFIAILIPSGSTLQPASSTVFPLFS
ncbi:MAG: fasciclin domain-containing protein [Robiginitalea sp.]